MKSLLILFSLFLVVSCGESKGDEIVYPKHEKLPAETVEDLGSHVYTAILSNDFEAFMSYYASAEEMTSIISRIDMLNEEELKRSEEKLAEVKAEEYDELKQLFKGFRKQLDEHKTTDFSDHEIIYEVDGFMKYFKTDFLAEVTIKSSSEKVDISMVLDQCFKIDRGWVFTGFK